jgi:hypothetical protein
MQIDGHMPVAGAWHLQPYRGLDGTATDKLVTHPTAVAAEIRTVHEADIRRIPRERDFNDLTTATVAKVVMNKLPRHA